jgi:isopentenyl-diphosphate Delta-isomerase
MDTALGMQNRKSEHIQICSNLPELPSSLEKVVLPHTAIPKCSPAEINLDALLFEKKFSFPILITGMTGGVDKGKLINETLAQLASERNIPMGLGSQRLMMLNETFTPLFDVKKKFPNVFLIGNVGAVSIFNHRILNTKKQLLISTDAINKTISKCKLNAFAIHLNSLQECIQPEGEKNFSHLIENLAEIIPQIDAPVMIKEVGAGMSVEDIEQLLALPIKVLDIAGTGGTSWAAVEGLREPQNTLTSRLGELFKNTGISTADCLVNASRAIKNQGHKNVSIVATGGIRNGIHIAKAIKLGAHFAGVGLPFFKAAISNEQPFKKLLQEFEFFEQSLRISLCHAGTQSVRNFIQEMSS